MDDNTSKVRGYQERIDCIEKAGMKIKDIIGPEIIVREFSHCGQPGIRAAGLFLSDGIFVDQSEVVVGTDKYVEVVVFDRTILALQRMQEIIEKALEKLEAQAKNIAESDK